MAGFRIPNPFRADVGFSASYESSLGNNVSLLPGPSRVASGPQVHLADEAGSGPSAYMPEVSLLAAPDFSSSQGTIDAIKAECVRQGLTLITQVAYVLATVDHETNHTFKPVREAYWLKDPDAYLKKHHPEYYPYYGRGFVQLTWYAGYERYSRLMKKDLINHPDLALDPAIALFILVHGFVNRGSSRYKLDEFVNELWTDYVNARRCINLLDRADHIASLARGHLAPIQSES